MQMCQGGRRIGAHGESGDRLGLGSPEMVRAVTPRQGGASPLMSVSQVTHPLPSEKMTLCCFSGGSDLCLHRGGKSTENPHEKEI